ncbi:MAG: lysophospholipid acyltransferase family protein [Acidimicrobiales bacterium]
MLGRRLLSIPAVLLALPALLITAPIWLLVGAIVDLAGGLRRLPTVRLGLFGVAYVVHEWAGLLAAAFLFGRDALFGPGSDRAASTEPCRRVQAWWVGSLLTWAERLVGVRYTTPDPATLPSDRFILLSRHASMVDAVLPAALITRRLDRFAHYIIKAELQWVPNLDVFGHRLGNHFVARDGDGDAEANAIARFARSALPNSALVIFPEGTYSTPQTRQRVVGSLEQRKDDELADFARSLRHLLPPKPAGTLALLNEQPDVDVVVMGHVGLEGVATLSGLRRRLPLTEPVVVEWWHHRRAELPTDDVGRIAWLNDRWRTLDAWIATVEARTTTVPRLDPDGDGNPTTGR